MVFDVNQLLRYFTIGVYFVFLSYLTIEPNVIQRETSLLGNDNFSTILIGLCLLSGTMIYVIYRSFFYGLIIDNVITMLTNKRRIREFYVFSGMGVIEIIALMDKKRMAITDDSKKRALGEWASQVHFLYNLAISSFIVSVLPIVIPCVYIHAYNFAVCGIVQMVLAIIHHIRYKWFEIEMIK